MQPLKWAQWNKPALWLLSAQSPECRKPKAIRIAAKLTWRNSDVAQWFGAMVCNGGLAQWWPGATATWRGRFAGARRAAVLNQTFTG
jgi:hypothetical protein